MPDFAQNSSAIIQLLIGAGCLLWIYNQVMIALGKRKNEQPFIVSMEKRFVSHEEHKDHTDAVKDKFKEVDGKLITAAISRKGLHEGIESLGSRTTRLEEQNVGQTNALNLLSADFRDFRKEQGSVNSEILKRLPK